MERELPTTSWWIIRGDIRALERAGVRRAEIAAMFGVPQGRIASWLVRTSAPEDAAFEPYLALLKTEMRTRGLPADEPWSW